MNASKRPGRFESPRGLRMIDRIVTLLEQVKVPMSMVEIAAELHCTPENVRRYLVHLVGLKVDRVVRIGAWQQSGTRWMALYVAGCGHNKKKPRALTKADLHRNMMADPVAHALELACRRNWRRKKKGQDPVVTAAPWCAALAPASFGGMN